MHAVELQEVGSAEWDALLAGEQGVWGPGEQLDWARKTHHVGVLSKEGSPLALAAAVVTDIRVAQRRLAVAGIGSVIVTRSMRGQGLARLVIEAILLLACRLGPERAMLFCDEPLIALYERFGFQAIEAPVTALQPSGAVRMPMRAMWAPLADGVTWPQGEVDVLGLPF